MRSCTRVATNICVVMIRDARGSKPSAGAPAGSSLEPTTCQNTMYTQQPFKLRHQSYASNLGILNKTTLDNACSIIELVK